MFREPWRTMLMQLEGSSVRVTVGADPGHYWVGLLGSTDRNQVIVELADTPEVVLKGTAATVEVLHQGGVYQFTAAGWNDQVHSYRLRFDMPQLIQVVQRRAHPRVRIMSDLMCWSRDGNQLVARGEGRALDISFGGMAFEATTYMPLKTRVYVQLRGGALQHLGHLEGEVLRVTPRSDGTWTVGMAFRNLAPRVMADLFELVQGRLKMEAGFLESAAGFLE